MTNKQIMKSALLNRDYLKWLSYTPEWIQKDNDYTPYKILALSFEWRSTKEGYNYWNDIFHALKFG